MKIFFICSMVLNLLACKSEAKVLPSSNVSSDTILIEKPEINKPESAQIMKKNEEKPKQVKTVEREISKKSTEHEASLKVDEIIEDKTKTKRPARKPDVKEIEYPVTKDETEKDVSKELKVEDSNVSNEEVKEEKLVQTKGMHDDWNSMLAKYVTSSGFVDYTSWKSDEKRLDKYLSKLKEGNSEDDKNAALAFWINTYNAFTIKLILENYPVKSIMNLDNGKVWDRQWITIKGKTYSLNDIEHNLIRPRFKDARIHFAVNCAAKSCPPILNKAYTAENVQKLLRSQTKKFVNSKFNDLTNKEIVLSKIFEWYAEDFGDIIEYINKYANNAVDKNSKIRYVDYDWSLNGK